MPTKRMEEANEQQNSEHYVHIGERDVWGGTQPLGLWLDDRARHVYVVGQTGVGKTSLLLNLLAQDIAAGLGVALLDPHGDMAESLLSLLPPARSDALIYFDPSDIQHPIGFNLLANVEPHRRHLVVAAVVDGFRSVWGDSSWGPRLSYILTNAIAALLECQNVSLLGIGRMLSDDLYLDWVIRQVKDPAVRQFWCREYTAWDKRFRAEAVSPIQNKVGALTRFPAANILGQVKSAFDVRYIMDHQRIFIANLSKGRLGADLSNLIGALLVSQFELAAMSRADISPDQRRPFMLYVDELQNFGTSSSFAAILSESRKYALHLTVSHQYIEQLPDSLRDSIFGNVGSLVAFRTSESNGAILSRAFGGAYPPEVFMGLDNFQICCRLLQGGTRSDAFLGRTLPPTLPMYGKRDTLLRRSRERYATPRSVVEEKIRRWMRI